MQATSPSENSELMARARRTLQGHWGLAVAGFAIYWGINLLLSLLPVNPLASFFVNLLLAGPLVLGLSAFSLALSRQGRVSLSQVFEGFDGMHRLGGAVASYLLLLCFILFWLLLLVIPGIVAAVSYSMTFFLLVDDPGLGPLQAISESKRIMRGHRIQYILLMIRFTGWFFLAILTLGVAFLWVAPYFMVSLAQFYDDVRSQESSEP